MARLTDFHRQQHLSKDLKANIKHADGSVLLDFAGLVLLEEKLYSKIKVEKWEATRMEIPKQGH
jgi:hypothetical protein